MRKVFGLDIKFLYDHLKDYTICNLLMNIFLILLSITQFFSFVSPIILSKKTIQLIYQTQLLLLNN